MKTGIYVIDRRRRDRRPLLHSIISGLVGAKKLRMYAADTSLFHIRCSGGGTTRSPTYSGQGFLRCVFTRGENSVRRS